MGRFLSYEKSRIRELVELSRTALAGLFFKLPAVRINLKTKGIINWRHVRLFGAFAFVCMGHTQYRRHDGGQHGDEAHSVGKEQQYYHGSSGQAETLSVDDSAPLWLELKLYQVKCRKACPSPYYPDTASARCFFVVAHPCFLCSTSF